MDFSIGNLIFATISGGFMVKIIDWVIQFICHKLRNKKNLNSAIDVTLDYVLKNADEMVGKTISLARKDFSEIDIIKNNQFTTVSKETLGVMYLYAQLWCNLELIKRDKVQEDFFKDSKIVALKQFIACLESPKIRLVDKMHQKAIGELIIKSRCTDSYHLLGLTDFCDILKNDFSISGQYWFKPLLEIIGKAKIHKSSRQKLLIYGVFIHMMIDFLDHKHSKTHLRKSSYPNKLNKSSKNLIKGIHREYFKNESIDVPIEKFIGNA